ncbi:Rv3235 family protein [Leifsonia sp. McL0607]|uniref:Rv3235 family protein n=1 Tax=Leifsonia sp. McL0607 TaxID=3415672 RepID=UPI003CE7E8D8
MNALLTSVLDRDDLRRDELDGAACDDTSTLQAPPTRPPTNAALQDRPRLDRSTLGRPPLSVVQQDPDPDLRLVAGLDGDPSLLSAKLALCVIEILAGARPLDQLGRWVSDSVYVQLLRRTVIASRSREVTGDDARRPRVRVGEPMINRLGETIVDAVVMIHQPTRSRAVALRLERHRKRWRATAISVL